MNRTVAFDNKKGVWKTRYSFFSSCIAWVKDFMVTSPTGSSGQSLFWRHDGKAETNNTFYGNQSPSVIQVSFNDRPSSNKSFKSVSVESPQPDKINGVNIFNVNGRTGSLGPLKQKGGILYGHVGVENRYALTNFEFIGTIKNIYSGTTALEDVYGEGYLGELTSTNYIDFDYVQMNALSSSAAGITTDPQAVKDGEEEALALGDGSIMVRGILFAPNISGLAVGDSLFFAYPSNIVNGDSPKGQVAHVTFALGNENFEVHAVNLEYSPTNLDHSN